jgi:hypothetical protein
MREAGPSMRQYLRSGLLGSAVAVMVVGFFFILYTILTIGVDLLTRVFSRAPGGWLLLMISILGLGFAGGVVVKRRREQR